MCKYCLEWVRRLRPVIAALVIGLLTAPLVQAQIGFGPQLSAAPSAATAGGTISVSGDRLLVGGDYRVILVVAANDRRTLATILNGDGDFQRSVVVPAIASGSYTLDLTVDNVSRDTATLRVLAPLAITLTPSSPKAGASVNFSVSGLTEGSLSLVYAGRTAFGPVNVSGSSYSGRFRVPTDRPAELPANVRLDAKNLIGRITPRVGTRTVSVQAANLNPFAQVFNATPSTATPGLRQRFNVSGSVTTNEANAADVSVQHFWTSANGQVVPMGAVAGSVAGNGNFDFQMLTPQIGTMSAAQASGPGQLSTVTQFHDANGVNQHQVSIGNNQSPAIDLDPGIDLHFILVGSDGLRIEGARIDLVEADLDALYPINQGPVRLDGLQALNQPTQFEGNAAVQAALGCPANIQRQYSDANGLAAFEFGLDVPQGGVNVDGSGPTPQVTIEPTQTCSQPDINTPEICLTVDPAGLSFRVVVHALHTGYGYFTTYPGSNADLEQPVTIDTRIDRYTGQITMDVNTPNGQIQHHTFQRSANLTLTLPDLNRSGLLLGNPYFKSTQAGSGIERAIEIESTNGNGQMVTYKPITDLSPLRVGASFFPAQPPVRLAEFQYNAGAGRPLREATLHIFRGNGRVTVPMTRIAGGNASCSYVATEVWQAPLPAILNEGFRFPGDVYGSMDRNVFGYVEAFDLDDRHGISVFKFQFRKLSADIAVLAGTPGLRIDTLFPHARKLEIDPVIGENVATSDAADPEYNLPAQRNAMNGVTDYEFCIPKTATSCGALSTVDFNHRQFDRLPATQPTGPSANDAGVINQSTGTASNPWEELFDYTVPLFRWYWGVPELLSAEVFADLAIRADYLLDTQFNPMQPAATAVSAGGRLDVGVNIGVDIDVLFGILLDAGASIYGNLRTELVTTTSLNSVSVHPCLKFTLDFIGWLEIGCPIPNPLDPTCYIPDIEETFNILTSRRPQGCGFQNFQSGVANTASSVADGPSLLWPGTGLSDAATAPSGRVPPVVPFPRELRRALYRTPALAFDGTGNRLLLNLDSEGRLVGREGALRTFGPAQIISSGFGIRDVAVSYYSTDRAVAVWAESRLPSGQPFPPLTRNTAASNQRLRYALFDGSRWGTPVNLTSGGFGEGQVKLARCRSIIFRGGCTQKVSLVFQRNTERTVGGDKHLFFAQFDGSQWTSPIQVDQTGTINITPTITYAAGEPVVAWVRYAPTTLGAVSLTDVTRRALALRVMDGRSNEEIDVAPSARGVAQPSLAGKLNGDLALAFTIGSEQSYIGTRQALHMGERRCAQPCAFTTWPVQDHHGRALYVERPTLNLNGDGEAVVTFRGLAYGAVPNAVNPEDNLFADDPVGMRSTRGELLQIHSALQPTMVRPLALSADGATHYQPVAAFDALNGEVVGVSVTVNTPEFVAQALRLPDGAAKAVAQSTVLEEGIQITTIADLPELFVESLSTTATQLTPGASIPVTIRIANRGSAWNVDASHSAQVRLWWDTPQTRTNTSASFTLGSLGAGASSVRMLQVVVPPAFGNDERQTLRAAIEVDSEEGEIDGDNNEATVAVGGMPVPTTLIAASASGTRFVNLIWNAPTDSRIAGYRIYANDATGVPQPFGSSFNKGWADLSALYGRQRTYRVSTYSARGIESELSAPVTAEPAPAPVADLMFADGFE